ncbi:MAG: hypothetical protein LLG14_17510 [Nocardiaceae bacterium]|nr:hypothetical protein [Nocardiaceae bacterium]
MTGTTTVVRTLLRRCRFRIIMWIVPLAALVAVTVPGYAAVYPSLTDRAPLVAELQAAAATKVLYGQLPLPGTLGQLAQWETGAYVVLLTAVMAILLTTKLTRGDEDAGYTELAATSGVGRWSQPVAIGLVLVFTFVLLGTAVGGVMALESIRNSEVSLAGSVSFGAVVALVGLVVAASTLVLAELLWDAASTRVAAWTLFAVSFALRVEADFGPFPQLRSLTWLGLKDQVRPFTDNNAAPLFVAAAVVVLLAAAAAAVHQRREFASGLLHPPAVSLRRLVIHSAAGLVWRLGRVRLAIWSVPVIAVSALFGGISRNLLNLISDDANTARMMQQMTATEDPVRQYFEFSSLFIVLLPLVYGVSTVLQVRTAERAGAVDAQAAVGVERWRPLAAQTGLAAAGAVTLLVIGGAVQSALADRLVGRGHAASWAWWTVVGQTPGVIAAVGITALLVGIVPGFAQLALALVAWSGFAVFFGELVRLPQWARNLAVLGHGPQQVTGGFASVTPWVAVAVMSALALAAVSAGIRSMRSRDLVLR